MRSSYGFRRNFWYYFSLSLFTPHLIKNAAFLDIFFSMFFRRLKKWAGIWDSLKYTVRAACEWQRDRNRENGFYMQQDRMHRYTGPQGAKWLKFRKGSYVLRFDYEELDMSSLAILLARLLKYRLCLCVALQRHHLKTLFCTRRLHLPHGIQSVRN